MARMTEPLRWITAYLDQPAATAPGALAFWEAVSGTRASAPRGDHDEFRTLAPPQGDGALRFQVVGDGEPRLHLDLHVDDVPKAVEGAVALGASILAEPGTHVVMTSPGGMPFCLVPHQGEHAVPPPVTWADGHTSAVDQVSLDIPPDLYESECAFWEALTGWTLRDEDTPEFMRLLRPPAMPLGLLLQRLGETPPGGAVAAHLDLGAGTDADAEVARHLALGAEELWRSAWWITLRDPSGRVYCVTRRSPGRPMSS